jgi:hypothetical protein
MLTIICTILNAEQSVHKAEPNRLKCEFCGKAFETPDRLSYHKSVEHSQAKRPPVGVS